MDFEEFRENLRPLAYITASFGDEDLDVKAVAAKYCRTVYEAGYSPICPALWQPYFLKKNKAVELKDGRDMANELLRRSRILIVCGNTDSDTCLKISLWQSTCGFRQLPWMVLKSLKQKRKIKSDFKSQKSYNSR